MVTIFLAFWFFAKSEKNPEKSIFFNFCHFWGFYNQCYWKFQFLAGKNFKDFIFCLIFAIFQRWLYWRRCKIFKKSSKMWQKMKKIDFSFFALNFSRKNEIYWINQLNILLLPYRPMPDSTSRWLSMYSKSRMYTSALFRGYLYIL